MRTTEAGALADAVGRGVLGIAGLVRDTHLSTSGAAYGALERRLGAAVRPVRAVDTTFTRSVYGTVGLGIRAGRLATTAAVRTWAPDHEPLDGSAGARRALDVLGGLYGDRLDRAGSPLARPMTLRHDGGDVGTGAVDLHAAYAGMGGRLVVFVHGLMENEDSWRYRATRHHHDPGSSYGSRLAREERLVPLWVRYNTGLPVATNASQLADLLDGLVEAWPTRVEQVALVGHSMGGLVVHRALADPVPSWAALVSSVITLGSPMDGAPLERGAHAVSGVAGRVPQAQWLAGLLMARSVGIQDLRHGLGPAAASPGHHAVLATLTRGTDHPLGARIGDGMVPVPRRHRPQNTVVLGGLNHLDLLNHPRVHRQLREWIVADGQRHRGRVSPRG